MSDRDCNFRRRRIARSRGFTLLELMIAVTVAAILAAIAFPSYRAYVLRANRAVARAVLVDIAAKLEVEALKTRQYPEQIGFYIGTDEIEIEIDQNGRIVAEGGVAADAPSIYKLKLFPASGMAEIRAEAVNAQGDDDKCKVLILSTSGRRTATPGNLSECWSR